jgi:hypothetical protein
MRATSFSFLRAAAPLAVAASLSYACGDADVASTFTDPSAAPPSAADEAVTDDGGIDGFRPAKDGSAHGDAADDDVADARDGGGAGWPTCSSPPATAPSKTIEDVWNENAAAPSEAWISGAVVTAVSRGGCAAGRACQLYVQSAETYASLADGARHAIKVFVSAATAGHFSAVAAGDRVDLLGWGWRYDRDGQNEILLQVSRSLPGCAKKVGTAAPTPIEGVTLGDLTRAGYEAHGPLLVRVASLAGKAKTSATETFGLFPARPDGGSGFAAGGDAGDAGADDVVSLSPFFLAGARFDDPPVTLGAMNAFASVTGVFGLFAPPAAAVADGGAAPQNASEYLELYPRSSADIVR